MIPLTFKRKTDTNNRAVTGPVFVGVGAFGNRHPSRSGFREVYLSYNACHLAILMKL